MADLGSVLESARPWVSTGALMALCEFARRLWIQNRQLKMAENKDDRDGYGVLIAALEQSIKTMEARHAEAIASLRVEHNGQLERIAGEHRRCEERLGKIEGELLGFHRQALMTSQLTAVALPATTMVKEAGERAVAAATERLSKIEGTGE